MSFVILERYAPVIVVRRMGLLDAAGMRQMLGELTRCLRAADDKIALVYEANASVAGSPPPAARQVAGEWFRDEEGLLARRCAGIDFAFASPLSRGVLSAVLWIARPPVPVQVHDTSLAAVTAAIARVGKQGQLDPQAILRAVGA